MRKPVRFAAAVQTLLGDPNRLLLEVGPRTTLAPLAQRQVQDRAAQAAIASQAEHPLGSFASLLDAAGQLWQRGVGVDWKALRSGGPRRRIVLPTYPFERQRHWIEPRKAGAEPATADPVTPTPALAAAIPTAEVPMPIANPQIAANGTTRATVVKALLEEITGLELGSEDIEASFLELGLDSLSLTQVALQLQRRFGVKLTFRQLMESYPNVAAVSRHLDGLLPPEPAPGPAAPTAPGTDAAAMVPSVTATPAEASATLGASAVERLINEQLKVMAQQLDLLRGEGPQPGAAPAPAEPAVRMPEAAPSDAASALSRPSANGGEPHDEHTNGLVKYDAKKAFGAIARIHLANDDLLPKQRARLDAFIRRYTARTRKSKQLTEANRSVLADPRTVTGFRPAIKELVYQVTIDRSQGSHLWDVDGNEYVDALNGFGASLFGWQPEFVTKAVSAQLAMGYEIGPMHPLAGEVAELFCRLTGFDRAGFCNTGSEAVLGAIRIARTVTGRSTIAVFSGSYHGIFDEVVVRGTKKLTAVPAAPGILPSSAENVIVLDYGTPESLEILRARCAELAAIVVEPVQSRRPDLQPGEFLRQLRQITEESGTALIMDEMVTGFRIAPGGAQEHFGVRGDLATYGKAVGGGFPIGIIAGSRQWMDALDGGGWQFGDDSTPTVGVTYFAGTFVRHPLALAAAKAVLQHLSEEGPSLQERLNGMTEKFAAGLNAHFSEVGAPLEIRYFGSLWKPFYTSEHANGDLLFYMLRDRGVHILEGFPCFFTAAHSQADVELVAGAFRESIAEMQGAGFLPEPQQTPGAIDSRQPPVPGARLGRDEIGNPAWFTPNPDQPGKFVLVAPK
jgi:glutamate-1-semialdehyde aminotransferase/acyl carrier protein